MFGRILLEGVQAVVAAQFNLLPFVHENNGIPVEILALNDARRQRIRLCRRRMMVVVNADASDK